MRKKIIVLIAIMLLSFGVSPVFAGDNIVHLSFDGVDDYVRVTHDGSLNFSTGDFTIEFWFRDSTIESDDILFEKSNIDNGPFIEIGFSSTADELYIYIADSDYTHEAEVLVGLSDFNGEWHHFFVTKNATFLAIWIDNIPRGIPADTSTLEHLDTVDNLLLGIETEGISCGQYDGDLDEVRVYTRELSAVERAYSYNNIEPQSEVDLVMWLRMNEGTGPTAGDETVNDNDGTLMPDYPSNAPTWVDDTPVIPSDAEEASGNMLSILSEFLPIHGMMLGLGFLMLMFSIAGYMGASPTMGESMSVMIVPLMVMASIGVVLIVLGVMGGF